MSEEPSQPQPPPNDGDKAFRKVMWLLVAFLPNVIALAALQFKIPGKWWPPSLAIMNLICCLAASVGLVRGMKFGAVRVLLGFFLFILFWVLNALIVLFAGCSGMGRIAP